MSFSSGGGGRRAIGEINVTPLVDVMLVLLIIFMVTAPLIQNGVQVSLPKAKADPIPHDDSKAILTLTRERRILVGKTEVPLDQLEAFIRNDSRLQRDKELYVHADRELAYGFVLEVMAMVRNAGVEKMGLVADPPEK